MKPCLIIKMCGIIAYKGLNMDSCSIVVQGLKNLEYRGYDSWGLAYLQNNKLKILKKVGKIGNFNPKSLPKAELAIGHTRWATHGGVTIQNAHPLLSNSGRIAVVHNGIIENYKELKDLLKKNGFKFVSQTDTETIPQLIEFEMNKGKNFRDAIISAVKQFKGRFAFVALDSKSKELIAVKKGSPLILGLGKDEYFLASDVPAFLNRTNKVIFLDDYEMVELSDTLKNTLKISDALTGKEKSKQPTIVKLSAEQADKQGYKHFMLKEIFEQKHTIADAIAQDDGQINEISELINKAEDTYIVGCGTAGRVALAGTYIFSRIAKKHVNYAVASEFPRYHDFLHKESLLIAISQSGETADTLEAIETAKEKGCKIISIVNAYGSTMTRISDYTIYINAGIEKAVAATKSATSQLAILTLLAYACAGKLGEGKKLLKETAEAVNEMLGQKFTSHIQKLAKKLKKAEHTYIIGRSFNYPMALEATIKLQEVAYIHAEGFAAGELKHGPIALIEKATPCLAIVGNDESKQEILSNVMEAKTRGAYIIGISSEPNDTFDFHIQVPNLDITSPIANIIPIQLLSYYISVLRGNDPDKPKNLAKSVTVK